MKKILQNAAVLLLLATLNAYLVTAHAQGTAFTYQGQLSAGSTPANGSYDLVFTLYTTNTDGIAIAGPATNSAVAVTNGLFTTPIDFGPAVFAGGSNWLEIAVRTNGGSSFATLVPRQPVTPVPYAITAESANNLAGLAVQLNASNNAPNLIGGSSVNFVAGGVIGATIGGGGAANYSGSPYTNSVTSSFSTVGGGYANTAGGYGIGSTVAGGSANTASGYGSTVAGGGGNSAIGDVDSTVGGGAGNTASGHYEATVGGGFNNTASGNFATIPGGSQNLASSAYSFAAGQQAQATNLGAFVWADSQNAPFASINNDSFNVRAQGGVRFVTGGAGLTVDGPLNSDGAPDWQVPAGTAVQAQSNTSYLLTNLQSVTLTLPASPNVGDMIEVFEAGSGGWTIAQNATQSVLYNVASASDNTWVQTSAPSKYWTCIACSSDGTKLVAAGDGAGIYNSTNSGATWVQTPAPVGDEWDGIASSSDGTKLAAMVLAGGIYTSTNSGANWIKTSAPNGNWSVIASSSDGTKLAAAIDGGGIYTSTNSGTNWILTSAPGASWFGLASSADGGKLAAGAGGGGIYTLSYFSANWGKTSATSTNYWGAIASSSDGSSLAAMVNYGGIYTSADSGANWVQTSAPSAGWSAIASSADGTKLVAVVGETGYSTATSGGIWMAGYGRAAVNTSTGTGGFLGGGQGSGVKLIYAGGGQFVLVNKQGSIYGE